MEAYCQFHANLLREVFPLHIYVCDTMNVEQTLLLNKDINPFLTLTIDMWAVGCIFAELLTLKPLFQGAEVKATPNPFQVQIFLGFFDLLMFIALIKYYIFMVL